MSYQLQQTIRNNATEVRQYVNDLYEWEQQMELKQKAKNKQRQANQKIRQAQQQQARLKKIEEEKKLAEKQKDKIVQKKKEMIRDVNTVQDYYKAWDKYDPQQEIKRIQQQQKRAYRPYNPYQDSKNNLRAKPQSKIVAKGTRNIVRDPTSLKDKGNVHFKTCQYDRAIDYYSECINKILNEQDATTENNRKLLALVYSNRAMSYIKINERAKALQDCNQSLKYDDKYGKTYLRRADCYRKLGRYKESLADYKKVKQLNPNQTEPDIQIKKIQQFLKRRIKESQQDLIVTTIPQVIPGGYRVEIQELDDFQNQTEQNNKQQKTNYLQEL